MGNDILETVDFFDLHYIFVARQVQMTGFVEVVVVLGGIGIHWGFIELKIQ